jgi:hypothetical protein
MCRRIVSRCGVCVALAAWTILGWPGSGAAQEKAATNPPRGERVFITGHSFHIFVGNRLESLARAAGIQGHQYVGQQYKGGSKVIEVWDMPEDKGKAKAALSRGDVDVLTMSPVMSYTPDDGIDRFVELGLKHNPRMRFLVQQSWPGWDDWAEGKRVAKNEERDTRPLEIVRGANKRFREALEAQAAALNKKVGHEAVFIAPVGDAVLKLRELIAAGKVPGLTKQSELFVDAIGHGTEPVITLTCYVNFACIYRTSPVGLKYRHGALTKLNPDLEPLLQQIAWDTVSNYRFSGLKVGKPGETPSK